MKIFYIDIEKFKVTHNKNFLLSFADKNFNTKKRFYQYSIGRYLVKSIAQNVYNIENTDITTEENGKPVFKNSSLCFSISHSKNIVVACFDKFPCGIDIEYIKPRNLEKLSEFFDRKFNSLEDFYKFWTFKEASYKLNNNLETQYFTKFQNEYYLSIVSSNKLFSFQNSQCIDYSN